MEGCSVAGIYVSQVWVGLAYRPPVGPLADASQCDLA